MRMLVIGSSDTSGTSLADPSEAWPRLVGTELGEVVGETVDVINVPVVPVGPKAVPRVEDALQKHEPDLVVFAFGPYHYIVATVGQRVRRRYGERVYRAFRKIETRFEGATAKVDGAPARLNHMGRWLARRIIGAEPLSTKEEVTGIQLEIMRGLARREGLIVVILHAPDLGERIDRENKGANKRLREHREYMTGVGRSHHFLIADCVPGFEAARNQAPLRHSDGVHKGAAGHRIQADAIMAALQSPASPLRQPGAAAPGAIVSG
ncbi:MAG: hypothetical protein HY875_05225 [Chloroflexi bacterium]|nr:hypothetical protein [Chloroflexota bacterium]